MKRKVQQVVMFIAATAFCASVAFLSGYFVGFTVDCATLCLVAKMRSGGE